MAKTGSKQQATTVTGDVALVRDIALGDGTRKRGEIVGQTKDDKISWSKDLSELEITNLELNSDAYKVVAKQPKNKELNDG